MCWLSVFFALVACSIYTGSPVSAARSRSDVALQLQVPLLPVGEQGCHAVLVRHVFICLLSHRTRATSGSLCCGALTRGVLPPCIAWCSCALLSHRGARHLQEFLLRRDEQGRHPGWSAMFLSALLSQRRRATSWCSCCDAMNKGVAPSWSACSHLPRSCR